MEIEQAGSPNLPIKGRKQGIMESRNEKPGSYKFVLKKFKTDIKGLDRK